MSAVFILIWGSVLYITVTEGAPVIVYVLLPILILVGFAMLGSSVYALIKTPLWIKRFEQKYLGEN
jgi:hypothetical protein